MVEKNKENSIGQVFTPDFVAEFMVKNALHFISHPDLKVLEPSVGEGVFLTHLIRNKIANITGYEIDKKLYDIISKKFPEIELKCDNFLNMNGSQKFDLIIGNPPYLGQNYNAEIFQDYVKKFPICSQFFVGNMDLFYFFIHQAITKLKPGGILTFITTHYWITKSRKTGVKLLKPHVLEECFLLQYVDLSAIKLFKRAKGQHNCIFVMQKKTGKEKRESANKSIEVIKIIGGNGKSYFDHELNHQIFRDLIDGNHSDHVISYVSALTNNDLSYSGSWNLLYPQEVRHIVSRIEKYCMNDNKIQYMKDYFMIRNGIIFIQDEIFILKRDKNFQIKDNEFYVKIDDKFIKILECEKSRLKKIYKSRAIEPFGFNKNNYLGYGIYFNKNEFIHSRLKIRNEKYEMTYPVLTAYLKQFEEQLKKILINAKENPLDLFFPRRGAFFKNSNEHDGQELIDGESLYESGNKIFFKYISEENVFGFSDGPYYATSDTYFLWKKNHSEIIDYPFIIAYLNSKIAKFLFKAKNIVIKRSKTKIEYGLPIPNLSLFHEEEERSIILVIRLLSNYVMFINNNSLSTSYIEKILSISYFSTHQGERLKKDIADAFLSNDKNHFIKIIDILFFQLFKLDERIIDSLQQRYY